MKIAEERMACIDLRVLIRLHSEKKEQKLSEADGVYQEKLRIYEDLSEKLHMN